MILEGVCQIINCAVHRGEADGIQKPDADQPPQEPFEFDREEFILDIFLKKVVGSYVDQRKTNLNPVEFPLISSKIHFPINRDLGVTHLDRVYPIRAGRSL